MCLLFALKSFSGTIIVSEEAVIRSDKPETVINASDEATTTLTLLGGQRHKKIYLLLWKFDLSKYKGAKVKKDVELSFGINFAEMETPFALCEVLEPWDETDVTWNSLIGDGADHSDVIDEPLDIIIVGTASGANEQYKFILPKDLVQKWIDNPNENFGVAVIAQSRWANHMFYTRHFWNLNGRPKLTGEFVDNAPATPENEFPTNGTCNVELMPVLKASAFFDQDGDKHSASRWKVATDKPCIKKIVWENEQTKGKLTEITVPDGILKNDTVYYWRVKYQDNKGRWSEWCSKSTNFKTKKGKTIAAESVNKAQAPTSNPQAPTRKSKIWLVIGGVVIVIIIIVVVIKIRSK